MSLEKQPMDRLVQAARIAGASRVIPDATKPEAVTPAQLAAVLAAVRAYQQRAGLKWKEISRAVGMHSTALSSLLNNRRVPRWQELAIDLDRWLEDELKREAAPRPSEFVKTRVAEEIFTVAEAACTLKCIGLVFGWAGMGKTLALQAVAADKPGSALVSIRTAAATPIGVLQAVAAAMGLRDSYNDNQRGLMLRLEQLLKSTPRLLIVDEIHKLCRGGDDLGLHVLRDLYDATGIPMLWAGTIDLISYLDRGQAVGREPLAQIRRRIGIARNLTERAGGSDGGGEPLYSVDEIRLAFARGKMRLTPEAERYLWTLANLPDSGALGTCRNLVVMATTVNESTAPALTAEMLRAVHRLLVSGRDYTLLQDRLGGAASRPLVKVG